MNFYFARDVIGDVNFQGLMSLVSMPVMLLGIPFVPMLFKKFGKRKTMIAGSAFSADSSLCILINPYSAPTDLVFIALKTIGTLPATVAIATLEADISDYNHMRNGVRSEGITTSAYSVGLKLGSGLGAASVLMLLCRRVYDSMNTLSVTPMSKAKMPLQYLQPC